MAALAQAQGQVPTKIAVINVQTAILSTKDGQKAAADLQTTFSPRQQDLEKKQAELTALQDQLRKGSATMSDEAKTKLMRDIDATTTRVNRDTQDAQSDLDEAQGKLMQELGGKMMAVMEKYATQNGYAVVLDVSNPQTPVLWAASAVDITNDIVKLYDQAYPGTAAAPPVPAAKPPAAAKTPAAAKPAARRRCRPRRRTDGQPPRDIMQAGGEYPMRTLVGFGLSLLLATGLFAQHHGGFSNPHPFRQGLSAKWFSREAPRGRAARRAASGGNPPFLAHACPPGR